RTSCCSRRAVSRSASTASTSTGSPPSTRQPTTMPWTRSATPRPCGCSRAARHGVPLVWDEQSASVVGRICRLLDGIPLAIELGAARLRVMSVTELDARLDQRFAILTGGSRAALPRHQTLLAMVDWSWTLLNVAERHVLARLSVFAGGFDLAAVEAVTAGG